MKRSQICTHHYACQYHVTLLPDLLNQQVIPSKKKGEEEEEEGRSENSHQRRIVWCRRRRHLLQYKASAHACRME